MNVSFRVTGKTPDELRAAADKVAGEFANGADYTIEIGEVYGDTEYSPAAPGRRPTVFGAMVTATVKAPAGGTS